MALESQNLSDQEAAELRLNAGKVFLPASPISVLELFAGRQKEIERVFDAVSQSGQHAIVYGERGVGKTSLANIVAVLAPSRSVLVAKVNCESVDTFESMWKKVLRQYTITSQSASAGFTPEVRQQVQNLEGRITDAVTSDTLRVLFNGLGAELLVIFDEFDRLPAATVRSFTDLIKTFSDNMVPATVLMVGVADNVSDLIHDHASIERALVQIPMPRMKSAELAQILANGAKALSMSFERESSAQIVQLSQGLPHYTHLVGRHSVRGAISRLSRVVVPNDVQKGMEAAVEDAQQSTKEQYVHATSSSHKSALFHQVLLACAFARKDTLSYFSPADVADPLSIIMKQRYEIPAFARHLKLFCEESRGRVLGMAGERHRYRYRFNNPLLEPYVVMRGLATGLLTPGQLAEITG
jgi:Cdc6-like AAA superfamily ATPase